MFDTAADDFHVVEALSPIQVRVGLWEMPFFPPPKSPPSDGLPHPENPVSARKITYTVFNYIYININLTFGILGGLHSYKPLSAGSIQSHSHVQSCSLTI